MIIAYYTVILTTMCVKTNIIGKNVKIRVQQSTLCYNLNQYKNKQIYNKETQKGIIDKALKQKRNGQQYTCFTIEQ